MLHSVIVSPRDTLVVSEKIRMFFGSGVGFISVDTYLYVAKWQGLFFVEWNGATLSSKWQSFCPAWHLAEQLAQLLMGLSGFDLRG